MHIVRIDRHKRFEFKHKIIENLHKLIYLYTIFAWIHTKLPEILGRYELFVRVDNEASAWTNKGTVESAPHRF